MMGYAISRDEQNAVASMMERYGTDFTRRLGRALAYADPDNASRIKAAFPEYWHKFQSPCNRVYILNYPSSRLPFHKALEGAIR